MRKYFIAFDYWGQGISEYASGIRVLDINKTPIIDVCKQMIVEIEATVDPSSVKIKITAFNNID